VPLCATLFASVGVSAPPVVLDLRYSPHDDDEDTVNPVSQYFGQVPPLPIAIRFLKDGVVDTGLALIGDAGPQRPRIPVYSARPVTAFLEEGATTQLKQWGLAVSNEADVVLQGEVKAFSLTEDYLFHAEITIAYSVRDREGKVIWQGEFLSEGKSFGVARKAQNYFEAASNALKENLRSLIAVAGFRIACTAKPSNQDGDRPMTPDELKGQVLNLMKEGLGEAVLVAFVRQARVSPPFTASGVVEWKKAGISAAVISAALEAAAAASLR